MNSCLIAAYTYLLFLFFQSDQPLNLLMPDLTELNFDEFKNKGMEKLNNTVIRGQRILKRASETNLFLYSNQAMQTAKNIPSKVLKNNHLPINEGTIAVDKMLQLEKLMTSTKEKLTEISRKISDKREVSRAWENVKIKLPIWQNSIANKLQAFQNRINKKMPPTKKEENVE